MASEHKLEGSLVVELDKQEAVNLIGLLTAQLARVPLQGNASGAVPSLNIVEDGVVKYRLLFLLKAKDAHM